MKTIEPSAFLRGVLLADALVSGAVALVQLALASTLSEWLRLPSEMLMATGAFLVGYVIVLTVLARSARISSAWVWLVVIGNVAWAIGCVALAALGAVQPSGLGLAFLAVQAVTVLIFAALEYRGLVESRASARAAWAA
jgi:hypothetical protein